MRSRQQTKAMFAHLNGKGMMSHLKDVIKIKEPKNKFAVDPGEFQAMRDPLAIQPQNSFLMSHPELGVGQFNLESRRPKKG